MNTRPTILRRLALLAMIAVTLTLRFAAPGGASAQELNPCLPSTIPPVFIPAPTDEPTATERPIGIPPSPTPQLPIGIPSSPTPRTQLPITAPGGSTDPDTLAFAQIQTDDECRPDENPTPDPCDDGPLLTPDPTETPEPTNTPTITPSPTFPIPQFASNVSASLAQIDCDPDDGDDPTPEDGDGDDPTPVVVDLPKTGTGADSDLQAALMIGITGAAALLFAAGVVSSRKRSNSTR